MAIRPKALTCQRTSHAGAISGEDIRQPSRERMECGDLSSSRRFLCAVPPRCLASGEFVDLHGLNSPRRVAVKEVCEMPEDEAHPVHSPHDKFFKETFSQREAARKKGIAREIRKIREQSCNEKNRF